MRIWCPLDVVAFGDGPADCSSSRAGPVFAYAGSMAEVSERIALLRTKLSHVKEYL
jgi:hypothetical protein